MAAARQLRRLGAGLALAGVCLLPAGGPWARGEAVSAAGSATALPATVYPAVYSVAYPATASPASASPAQASPAAGGLVLTDDWQRRVVLPAAPRRIVSLAPHATELLFAVGAGARVVAVDRASDQPPEARRLPALSVQPRPDPERLLALRPDLVVLWGAGADRALAARLEALGMPVFVSEPRELDDVAATAERFARLAEAAEPGLRQAQAFRAGVARLRARYAGLPQVPVFIQAWSRPLMTLSDRDGFSRALRVCGARNVFGEERMAAPQVSPEAVLRRAPRMVIGFHGRGVGADASRAPWDRLGMLAPRGPFVHLSIDDSIQRPTLGMLEPLSRLCESIDAVRRGAAPI